MTEELKDLTTLKRLSTLIAADESEEEFLETPKANSKPAISKKLEDNGFFGNLVEGLDTHQQLLAGVQDLVDSDQEEDTPTESVATNTSVDENE